ncbi:MAG: pyridoxal phosphate-dependent aminotransferase [Candidatus Bathyarchaeia archaeon]
MLETRLATRTQIAARHKELYDRLKSTVGGFTDIIDLSRGWSKEQSLPEHIVNAATLAVREGCDYEMFGASSLRTAIADKLERENGLEVDPERELLVTTGGSEAIYLAILALVNPDDEVIMSNPGYIAGYEPNILMSGGKMAYVPLRNERRFRIAPEDVERAITTRSKVLVLVSPEHPTGSVLDMSDLEAISEIAVRHNLIVISDEIFEKMIYDGRKHVSIGSLPGMDDRTITVNGFAKGYNMPGYRVGYVAGPNAVIERMANMQLHTTVSVNVVGQRAALAALRGPQDWIEEAVRTYEGQRNLFLKGLEKMRGFRCLKPEGGFFIFPNIKEFGLTSEEFANHLLIEAHVLTKSGQTFFGTRSEGHIRMSFTRPKRLLEEALGRINTSLGKLRPLS